jgi:hypothetical protein
LGFSVRIIPCAGATEAMVRRFCHALEDYGDERELVLAGTQLLWTASSAERSLTETDQVELLDWLIDQPLVGEVALMPLTGRLVRTAAEADGFVRLRRSDLCTVGLTLLYRSRRLTPAMYLQVLGGFVRPVVG